MKYGLEYKVFSRTEDTENWYGTFGPYIYFFCGFGLRMKELRLGHDKMPISKKEYIVIEIPVKKYGPPEKRPSMAQSVGPMTALLSMIRSEGIYRQKWASAVKRAFNHIPIIDDIIEITKTQKRASDTSTVVGLLAEIIMITTSRQATRAFFPLAMVYHVRRIVGEENRNAFLEFFNTTGSGAFFTYKMACNTIWYLNGGKTEEVAEQIVFHSIFGTYKEDLGLLEDITDTLAWKTREEMGKSFVKEGNREKVVRTKLPKLKYYSKMSCANMSGLLSGVYNQVSALPSFSGTSVRFYGDDFFEHIEKKITVGSTGKNMNQITASLSIKLDELRKKLKENRGRPQMGTTSWRSMNDLSLGNPGSEVNIVAQAKGYYFMGKAPTE